MLANLIRLFWGWLQKVKTTISEWIYRPPPSYCFKLGPQARESWTLIEEAMKTRKVWGKTIRKKQKVSVLHGVYYIFISVCQTQILQIGNYMNTLHN